MRKPALSLITLALAATAAHAGDGTSLAIYRANSDPLFAAGNPLLNAVNGNNAVNAGYAVAHEPRALSLKAGTQDITLHGLPTFIDTEALSLAVENNAAQVISQRLLLGHDNDAVLDSLVGQPITVLGDNGQVLANGTLLRAENGLRGGLLVQESNHTTLVRNYGAVQMQGAPPAGTGASLQLRVQAEHAVNSTALLSFPTAGLGWRASYVGTLPAGDRCRLHLESRASIANRSGSDWNNVRVTLEAGAPNIMHPAMPMLMNSVAPPAPVMAMAAPAPSLPVQENFADYHSYILPEPVDLPDGSVSQVPLYASRDVDCERSLVYETGAASSPLVPVVFKGFWANGSRNVNSMLSLRAFDSLPSGSLRVLQPDAGGTPQLVGESRINDTPKGEDVRVALGTAFDLHGEREQTHFELDKDAHTLNEAFRITITNGGNTARTVIVREHPTRWTRWTLAESNIKPDKQTQNTLEFELHVPANGEVTVNYGVHYEWTAKDQPQG